MSTDVSSCFVSTIFGVQINCRKSGEGGLVIVPPSSTYPVQLSGRVIGCLFPAIGVERR